MIKIEKIPASLFSAFSGVFRKEFDSDAPLPSNADIFGAFDDGDQLVGFVLAERLVMVGQIWTAPQFRDNSTEIVAPLVRTLRDKYDGKENVGAVASEPRFRKLFENLGMEKIDGEFYRKNV